MQAQKLIVQFGRLDPYYRDQIEFSFEGEKGKADLTSCFLVETPAFNGAERLIIFPSSIILQDRLLTVNDAFVERIAETDISNYFNSPETLLKFHPQVQGAKLLVVSSKGTYTFKGIPYHFNASLDLITIQIYLHLATYFSSDSLQEVYIDISSGLNLHIAAMMNALYRFLPFIKFKRFLFIDNEKVTSFILSADPILGKPTTTINIQKSPFRAKAFNTFPYKNHQQICALIGKVFQNEAYRKDVESLITKDYFLLHGALIYGAPLTLMLADATVLRRLFVEVGADKILCRLKEFFTGDDFDDSKSTSFDIYAFTFAVQIAQAIYFHFKEAIEIKEIAFEIKKKQENRHSISSSIIDHTFDILQKEYGQPLPDYKGELIKFVDEIKMRQETIVEFMSFASLAAKYNSAYKNNPNFNPRNFLAHGGLENNITEIKVIDDKVLVRYNAVLAESKRDSIINYMKK